jgi:hypothetical protein
MSAAHWPELPAEWAATYATLHMWTQIVGKVALAQSPPLNHSWGVALHVTPRGLTTRPLPHGARTFTIEFDFIDHRLAIVVSDSSRRTIPLTARSVSLFYREVMTTLAEMNVPVRIWPVPSEVPTPIRFDEDTVHASYEPAHANLFWRILVQCERVFSRSRCHFVGKASPVHFFWGAFDLAVTRFSGRPAPLREGPAFMREAYSHEVISHGFWPGSGPVLEPAFYAYAVPTPAGFDTAAVEPGGAYYDKALGEFLLPYNVMRSTADPDRALHSFITSTYEQAATLAGWDRAALERTARV